MKVCARTIVTLAIAITVAPMSLLHAAAVTDSSDNAVATSTASPSQPVGSMHPKGAKVELFLGYSRFGAGSNFSSGTPGNRMVGLNGGSAAIQFNLTRHIGLVGDFGGYYTNHLQLTGNGVNQPRTVNASGTAFTYLFGPRYTFHNASRFSPFAQVLAGGVHASAVTVDGCTGTICAPLPVQNSLALTAGGGLDIRLTHHVSLRPVQAEYMMTRFASVPAGSNSSQNDLRLSSGLVFRFGDGREKLPVQLACSAQPASAFAGDPVMVNGAATNLREKRPATYAWTTNGGAVVGSGDQVQINTSGVAPGTYTVSGTVTQGSRPWQQANCTGSFTVRAYDPPTVSCSANPSTVTAGDTATITASAASPQNRRLTYSYLATQGKIAGDGATASLSTIGMNPGSITVTCNVVDDLGKSASATAIVTAVAPAPVVATPIPVAVVPQVSNLCALSFERDRKRPVRVDNEAKACLDDIALLMQREQSAKLVAVGSYSDDETKKAGAKRALNEREYLTVEKGIDAGRIESRVGKSGGRTVTNLLVPVGATYPTDANTVVVVDP
jgi:hypothetical protein